MKLLYCKSCADIVKLRLVPRTCACGKSSGHYTSLVNADIGGPCLVLGLDNRGFYAAIEHPQRKDGIQLGTPSVGVVLGVEFPAFILPESARSIRRVD